MNPTMFFLINSIDLARGGLTRASLKQASFFAELGYDTYMLTFNFNPKYPIIRKKLYEMSKLHKNVVVRNMYEELEGYDEPLNIHTPVKKGSLTELSEGHITDKREGHNAYRIFNNGLYEKYIDFNSDGSLNFIDYFNENRYRTRREVYDPWGRLKSISYMDLPLNKPRQLIHYDNDGRAFFTQWNNPKSAKPERIIVFNDEDISKTYVKDNISHKVDWLTQTIDRYGGDKSVVISDTRSTDEVLVNLNHEKAAKLWRLHSHHLEKPLIDDKELVPKVKIGLNNIRSFDTAILLTEEQKEDVQKLTGEDERLKVVPHYYEHPKSFNRLSTIKKEKNRAVVVSRLSTLKQLDHIIKSFKQVIQAKPEAQIEIWGNGDQEEPLKKLIEELGLSQNVFMKGYTHNPDEVYQGALFSVLTSKKEGFALSVLESMYNRTPVISYDIKYGPTDMIVNNQNGFIVENNNISELAHKMIYMFNNPETAEKMGEDAKRYVSEHFNKEVYKEKWLDAIDQALKSKFN